MTTFDLNDKVTPRQSVQGMKTGRIYTVTGISELPTPFGNFVSYVLTAADGAKCAVQNGHLLLSKVAFDTNLELTA
jgi:hypothetical protein